MTTVNIAPVYFKRALVVFLIVLSFMKGSARQDKTADMSSATFPDQIFVVSNRVIDSLPDGSVIFTNKVDTSGNLKYLIVDGDHKSYFTRGFPDLDSLLNNPAPYKDWAVWVHGDGQTFEISLKRAREIQAIHKVNLIVFAWPTSEPGKGPIGNFRNSSNNALLTAPGLHRFVHELSEYNNSEFNRIGSGNLSIFFHSLGCYLLREALNMGYLQDIPGDLFDNMVLNAAATPSEGHAGWIEQLHIQARLYIVFNDEDFNLEGLRVLSGEGYQLGERPFPPLASNAIYLDFTESVGSRFPTGATHSYYFDLMTEISNNIRETYTILFGGFPLRFADTNRFKPAQDSRVYQVLF